MGSSRVERMATIAEGDLLMTHSRTRLSPLKPPAFMRAARARFGAGARAALGALAGMALLAAPAWAKPFEAAITGDVSAPIIAVDVSVNPEIVTERPGSLSNRSHRDRDDIGSRDAEILQEMFLEYLTETANNAGLMGEGDGLTLDAVIVSVRTNNPGFTERGFRAGVSASSSIARGQASVEATLRNADGDVVGTFAYSVEELSLDRFSPRAPWATARRVFRTFSKRTVAAITDARGASES